MDVALGVRERDAPKSQDLEFARLDREILNFTKSDHSQIHSSRYFQNTLPSRSRGTASIEKNHFATMIFEQVPAHFRPSRLSTVHMEC